MIMDETPSEMIIRENRCFEYDSVLILTPQRKTIMPTKLYLTACNYFVPIAVKIVFNFHVSS
jgi:hypothetical protein